MSPENQARGVVDVIQFDTDVRHGERTVGKAIQRNKDQTMPVSVSTA